MSATDKLGATIAVGDRVRDAYLPRWGEVVGVNGRKVRVRWAGSDASRWIDARGLFRSEPGRGDREPA